MAHLDTGASITSIDRRIAAELELHPIGVGKIMTASGEMEANSYGILISFPNTQLRGYRIRVSDCKLPYNGNRLDLSVRNYGVLIGRDIMANWNIVWNGPSSTVIISD
jgi:predicted aspartyl protease